MKIIKVPELTDGLIIGLKDMNLVGVGKTEKTNKETIMEMEDNDGSR